MVPENVKNLIHICICVALCVNIMAKSMRLVEFRLHRMYCQNCGVGHKV